MRAAKGRARDSETRTLRRHGLAIFALAFVLRLLFWQATPDSDWSYPALYKGDVPVWIEWSHSISEGQSYEQGIPFRPPGNAYLFSAFDLTADGAIARLRAFWCLLGAATVLLIFLAVNHSWGLQIATLSGLLCAGSTGLIVLSVSPNNETPYLFLVVLILYLWRFVEAGGDRNKIILWSSLNGLACLLRAEHLLFYLLLLAWVGWRMRSKALGDIARGLAISIVTFVLVLLPWQVKAHRDIRAFNEGSSENPEDTEAALQQVEDAVRGVTWTQAALDETANYPAAARRPAAAFVAATVARRGRSRVKLQDLEILDEAFGYRPEKLGEYPFVAIYGGLNFYLANHASADGGFSRDPLNRKPALAGGIGSYPPALVQGLPPEQLSLSYPPHLQAVNHGFQMGWDWIRAHPGDFFRLIGRKIGRFTAGLTLGFGGWNFPTGFDGERQSVDMTVPSGGIGTWIWTFALLTFSFLGLRQGSRNPALMPWLLFLLSRFATTLIFFGYARHGALAVPVLILLLASGPAGSWLRSHGKALLIVGGLLIGAEAFRWVAPPTILVDGVKVGKKEAFLGDSAEERRIIIEWPSVE